MFPRSWLAENNGRYQKSSSSRPSANTVDHKKIINDSDTRLHTTTIQNKNRKCLRSCDPSRVPCITATNGDNDDTLMIILAWLTFFHFSLKNFNFTNFTMLQRLLDNLFKKLHCEIYVKLKSFKYFSFCSFLVERFWRCGGTSGATLLSSESSWLSSLYVSRATSLMGKRPIFSASEQELFMSSVAGRGSTSGIAGIGRGASQIFGFQSASVRAGSSHKLDTL